MIYLKTYFYVEHEIKFLHMNLIEAYNHIDAFIICEFNRTHTGMPREFFNREEVLKTFPQDMLDKVLYLQCDISKMSVEAYENEDAIHSVNEPVMRSAFMRAVDFNDEDIIISVDADEIIYEKSYEKIIEEVNTNSVVQLKLHQFYYKMTYLWEDKDFIAPTAAKYYVYKNSFPCNWRYEGKLLDDYFGCHFSWCMSPKEMVYKLHTYSHPKYRFCADEKLLEKAIEDKLYPFDDGTNFKIKELPKTSELLPRSIFKLNLL